MMKAPCTLTLSALLSSFGAAGALVAQAAPAATLADRMAHYRVPGVSIAIVDSGRVVWAHGFGVRAAGTNDPVTPATLFQAASISKPIAATAMLRLVDQGRLSLDADVNTYLKTWRVPDNAFTAKEKVTLRRLATHSAGLTVHGFPGYAKTAAIPTVAQLLDGTKPANTSAVRVDTFPGTFFRYSGGGTTVMQLVMSDATGRPFPQLMRELVLTPLGMNRSTFEQPPSFDARADVASGHRRNGSMIVGGWHIYPEMAAAGLWTNPTELMQWAIEIAAAREGTSTKLLSQTTASAMLTSQVSGRGIGPALIGYGPAFRFFHGGSNEGYKAEFIYFPTIGKGAAVMTNGDGGTELIMELWGAIGAKYAWPEYPRPAALSLPAAPR